MDCCYLSYEKNIHLYIALSYSSFACFFVKGLYFLEQFYIYKKLNKGIEFPYTTPSQSLLLLIFYVSMLHLYISQY